VRIKGDLETMGHVDQEPKLVGRNVVMVLSPLPESQRERKFKLSHGDLIEEDDFEEDDLEENDLEEEGSDAEVEDHAGDEEE
jgi:translation initiation factor IF-3